MVLLLQGSDYGSAMPTSKGNTPNTMTPPDSAGHTPGMSSSGSRNSSMDDPRTPATTPDPARPVSFDFGQGPPRGPRQSVDVGSDLSPGSELNSPIQSRAASMDYGPNAPPPSLAGRQHPSGEAFLCSSLRLRCHLQLSFAAAHDFLLCSAWLCESNSLGMCNR